MKGTKLTRYSLLIILMFNVIKHSKAANYYWRASAVNNLFTNVGNWETSPGNLITPGVAPTSGDSVFFPVTSNISTINLNGGNCGVLTVTSPTLFTFTGTGNFYSDVNANGNILFSGTVNFLGAGVKNINLDSNPNTSTVYFSGGRINFTSGTINLTHNFFTNNTVFDLKSTLTQFNSNGFEVEAGIMWLGNNTSAIFDFSNSKVRATQIRNTLGSSSNIILIGTRLFLTGSYPIDDYYPGGITSISLQSIILEGTGGLTLDGLDIKIDSLIIKNANSVTFGGTRTITIDSSLILEKHMELKGNGVKFRIDTIVTPSFCEGQSVFSKLNITMLSPITINTIAFKEIIFNGMGVTSTSTNDVFLNTGSAITWTAPLAGNTFHWVGSTGDWNDPTQWSLLGSGGTPQLATGCLPTFADSVVFDDNSFSSVGDSVYCNKIQALCKSFNCIDIANEGIFVGKLFIAGNINISGVNSINTVELLGKGSHTITSGNIPFNGDVIVNSGGDYTLVDSLKCSTLYHHSGDFFAAGNNINLSFFRSTSPGNNSPAMRTMDISNTNFTTAGGMLLSISNLLSFNTTNSSVYVTNPGAQVRYASGTAPNLSLLRFHDFYFTATTGTVEFYTGNLNNVHYNDVYYNSNGRSVYGGYTANTLNFTSGKTYTFTAYPSYVYEVLTGINTIVTSCNDLVILNSTGGQAQLYKASLPFNSDGLMVRGINATGATLTVNNGVDLGNNINVSVVPGVGRDMYWVNNSGNWDDGSHWSIGVSGGNPAVTNPSGCIPRPIDNVFFDTNSFTTTGQNVTFNIDGACKDMTWDSNATSFSPNFIKLSNSFSLDIYGSLKLSNGMSYDIRNTNFKGTQQGVNSQTVNTEDVNINTLMYFSGGGRYDIIHDIKMNIYGGNMYLSNGDLYTNGYDIRAVGVDFNLSAGNIADISNSTFNLRGYTARHYATGNFFANNSNIINTNSALILVYSTFTDTIEYNNIKVGYSIQNNQVRNSPISFNKVEYTSGSNTIAGTFIIDTLIFPQSSTNRFDYRGHYSVLDTLIANGTPCVPITFISNVVNTPVTIKSGACNFDIQFGNIQDMTADLGSGCTTSDYRVFGNDAGGNANWNFVTPPSTNQLGNDTTVYCTEAPYTINTDGFGSAPATYLWNTGETTKTIEVDTGGIYSVYVTYTAGCIAFDTVVVTIIDTVAPVLTCPLDSTVYLNGICQYVLGDFTDSVAVDDCTPDSALILTQLPVPGTVYSGESIQTIWIYAEDNYGNIDSCSFQLTLLDTLNPIVTCKDTTIYLNASGIYSIDTSYIFVNANDNCGVDSIWIITSTFNCTDTGLNTVTVYARDNNNNLDSCLANITVLDTINPTVVCNDTTIYLDTTGQYTIDTSYVFANANDNCGLDSIWITPTNYTCLDTGLNTVTLYVRDNNNNVDSCIANVTVLDTLNPIVTCQDTTVYLNTLGTYVIDTSYVFANATDNCGIDSIWITTNTFNCTDTGVNPVTVYVRDNNNNLDSCIANVTVLDTLNPLVTCKDTTVYLNVLGTYTIDTSYVFVNASDNCGVDSLWITTSTFNCMDTGLNTVTIYARDNNNNVDSCIATVTVLDTLNPIVVCKDTTVYLNTLGVSTIDTSYVFVNASDNCGLDSIWITTNTFNCADTGLNTVTVYARDNNNNIDSCMANVTVLDTLNPIVTCKDTTVYLNTLGAYTIDTSYVFVNANDNCGIDSIWITNTSFTCADTGLNTVTIYARDVNNNIDSCQSNVTVLDTINPTISCQNAIIYLDTNGQFIIDTSYVYSSAFAGCGLDSIWIVDSVFDCSRIGVNTVSVYARDINGNVDSCQAQVTVIDSITPQITCGSTLYDTVSNSCEYTVPDFRTLTLPTDNCTDSINFQITQVPAPGTLITVQDQHIETIEIRVLDTNGNESLCMFDVELTCSDEFQIPEFISPNGDGKNDTWIITGIEAYPNNNVKVFNRYGSMVYQTNGYHNQWDGTANVDYIFQTGETDGILPSGTYFYRLELDVNNKQSEVYTGMVQLQK